MNLFKNILLPTAIIASLLYSIAISAAPNANPKQLSKTVATPIQLKADPWRLNADGEWVTTVYTTNTALLTFHTNIGEITPLPHWVLNARGVRLVLTAPTDVMITAKVTGQKKSATQVLVNSPEKYFSGLQMTASAVGPSLVNIGWYMLDKTKMIKQYRLVRHNDDGTSQTIATIDSDVNTYHDSTVLPNHQYQYQLFADTTDNTSSSVQQEITTPAALKKFPVSIMTGKGITLYFSTQKDSPYYYEKLAPTAIVADLKAMDIQYVLLRTVYGPYSHISSPQLIAWLNALLDEAHDQGIAILSWSIPQNENTQNMLEDIKIASQVSPKGNTFVGIALDLEIGKDYITDLRTAKQQISDYVKLMRAAVGPDYLLSIIIMPPVINSTITQYYPYSQLAIDGSVIQPMEFWHHYLEKDHHVYTPQEVTNAMTKAINYTRGVVGKNIPINVIGQITNIDGTGVPSAEEIATALQAAKNQGALGFTFFNWNDNLILNNDSYSSQAQAAHDFKW